jgi:hypothetical protein
MSSIEDNMTKQMKKMLRKNTAQFIFCLVKQSCLFCLLLTKLNLVYALTILPMYDRVKVLLHLHGFLGFAYAAVFSIIFVFFFSPFELVGMS